MVNGRNVPVGSLNEIHASSNDQRANPFLTIAFDRNNSSPRLPITFVEYIQVH